MNDKEKALLQSFWENEPTREAVRRALIMGINSYSPLNFQQDLDNMRLGEQVRAVHEGFKLVQIVFNNIGQNKKQEKVEDKNNPAR